MKFTHAKLAREIRHLADLLVTRSPDEEALEQAHVAVSEAVEALSTSEVADETQRLENFFEQMVAGQPAPADGEPITSFLRSPFSGEHNPIRPPEVTYRRSGEGIAATVVFGAAFEGRPGRAHGGATAAMFDDLMGAVQRVIGTNGYTRTLEVSYRGPVPIDEPVEFIATCVAMNDRTFDVESTATHNGTVVATAAGTFTKVRIDKFFADR